MARILVVDDDATIRQLLTFAFSMEGHSVETLGDGRGVVEALREASERVIVFMDVMMPHIDGLEVCRQLQEESLLLARHAIVLMSAGLTQIGPLPTAVKETLPKPFNLERALKLVELLSEEPAVLITSEAQQAAGRAPTRSV
jgi:CheY-like chemotaxis protein